MMRLQDLLKDEKCHLPRGMSQIPAELEIAALTTDSRQVKAGTLFIAVVGGNSDGHLFLDQALASGASALVIQKGRIARIDFSIPVIEVDDTRSFQATLARRFYRDPSQRLLCFGVTGTNGKTSVTYILEHLLNRASLPAGVIGTIDHHLQTHDQLMTWPSQHTTPDPILLQKRLFEMKALGAKAVAMEVSSHGLQQGRVDGMAFNTVIFTNLTRDHLDYHGTMNQYFEAKQLLFTDLLWTSGKMPLFAIINRDDSWGIKMRISSLAGLWTYGMHPESDFRYQLLHQDFEGAEFKLTTPLGELTGKLPFCGIHNVANVVAAIAGVASVGIGPEQAFKYLKDFSGVPGRLQRVSTPISKSFEKHVFVDYAHTPDGLENTLKTLVDIRAGSSRKGKIITVFGCGGDRDKGKRPEMAQIAEKYSDLVVVTSDNPRTENPEKILADIDKGFTPQGLQNRLSQVDREKAIFTAIEKMQSGDVLLIAGKGHEQYQIFGTESRPFSDVEVAKKALDALGAGRR